jgi:hypothetical protein
MKVTDDIDYVYTLHQHGWSTYVLYIDGEKYEMVITHVFGDPIYDFISCLIGLLEGKDEVSFIWYGEPGGNIWHIKRNRQEKHKATFTIDDFGESYGESIKETDRVVVFEMKIQQFVLIGYYQMKKVFSLLKEKSYAANRQGEFPFEQFKKLETLLEVAYKVY